MTKKSKVKSKRKKGGYNYTLVQAANGTYFFVSPDKCPIKLDHSDESQVNDWIKQLEANLTKIAIIHLEGDTKASCVHAQTPDLFP